MRCFFKKVNENSCLTYGGAGGLIGLIECYSLLELVLLHFALSKVTVCGSYELDLSLCQLVAFSKHDILTLNQYSKDQGQHIPLSILFQHL